MRSRSENEVSAITARPGRAAAIARVASMPSMTGISMSIRTTSGSARSRARPPRRRPRPPRRRSTSSNDADELREPGAHDAVVVHDQHADHAGTSSDDASSPRRARVDGRARRRRRARSVEQREPDVAPSRRARAPASKPRPSSSTEERSASAAGARPARRRGVARRAPRRCGAPPARRGRRAPRRRRARSSGHVERLSTPRARERAATSSSAASSPTARRFAGWISTSSVRRRRMLRRSASRRLAHASRASRVVPSCAATARGERDARQVLDDAVVQVGGDAPPLGAEASTARSEQLLALLLPAPHAPRQAPGQRQPARPAARQRREQRTARARASSRRPPAVDAAAAGRARRAAARRRGAQRQVDLEQRVLVALVAVLGLGEVAHARRPRRRCAAVPLVLAEREALADQARLVRVDDAAVLASQILTRAMRS